MQVYKHISGTRVFRPSVRGSNFDGGLFFCFLGGGGGGGGEEDPSTTISGSSSAHQRNAIKWPFAGVPMMVQH